MDYGFTLGALALKPSDFCNVRVYLFPEHKITGKADGLEAEVSMIQISII